MGYIFYFQHIIVHSSFLLIVFYLCSGKLPITFYRSNFVNEQNMTSLDLTVSPGRTYRYYSNPVTFPFGFGLSYTTFELECVAQPASTPDSPLNVSSIQCKFANTGDMDGDAVLHVYHAVSNDLRSQLSYPVPIRSLVDFTREFVAVGSTASNVITFPVTPASLGVTNNDGARVLEVGLHLLTVTDGAGAQAATVTIPVQVSQTVVLEQPPHF